ncbi:MAG TPA: response regulator transcription factor [Candidatus Kapabacteria bacterium]|nr:response regulator transcription factor [Candidatus Kapabacteria bacterium]
MYELLIIDDFQISALGTKALLAGHSVDFNISTAFSVDDGIAILKTKAVDLVLCDILMPEKDGFDALKSIKDDFPNTKVMFLSMNEDKNILYKALAFEADGYQFKNISKEELLSSIHIVLNGKKYFNSRIVDILYSELVEFADNTIKSNPTKYPLLQNTQLVQKNFIGNYTLESLNKLLTHREISIFELIGENYSTKAIAEKLGISIFTVSTHRKNIYTKLNLPNLTSLKKLAKKVKVINTSKS